MSEEFGVTEPDPYDEAIEQRDEARAERDGAYRERARLVAFLSAAYPAELTPAESDSGAWFLVFVSTPAGQMSWHLHEDDLDLFPHLVNKPEAGVTWDGHTTTEKYDRLADLTDRMSNAGGIARLDTALKRLADEDTWVLGEGFGGGEQEELHVRASLAKQALGQPVDCCTECMVSLGLDPDDEDGPAEAGEASRRDALDAQPSGDLAARLRAVLLDLRTNPTEARIQALHLLDEDEQRAADLRAHVAGMGGPSPAWVTDNAAGVRPGDHDDQAERDDVLRMRREMAREAGDDRGAAEAAL